ncbi:Dabb family protein [Echinicola marina]|uniref:Dabb family protein n=1 Tax=Echinicola marina TaxID=2859768 RepID=UPI001CF6C046|nr:Dabb family protein [Echinicola marina]UCS93072.1 Dabb family protein [Echinicola marina]
MNARRKFLNYFSLLGSGILFSNNVLAKPKKDFMIHQVYFWLKNPKRDLKSFIKGCEELIKVDSIKKAYIGQPAVTERRDVVDHSFHVSLTVHFDNIEDHNIYQLAAIHKKFIADHEDKWEKVQVYDTKIQ